MTASARQTDYLLSLINTWEGAACRFPSQVTGEWSVSRRATGSEISAMIDQLKALIAEHGTRARRDEPARAAERQAASAAVITAMTAEEILAAVGGRLMITTVKTLEPFDIEIDSLRRSETGQLIFRVATSVAKPGVRTVTLANITSWSRL